MNMYKTDAIVLKKMDAGETDAVFLFYTKEFGKMSAYAQGVKKEAAKLKGHLEPLNLVNIGFVQGKHRERLIRAELKNYWSGIRHNLDKINTAIVVLEIVDTLCLPGEKDESLWRLLLSTVWATDEASAEELPKKVLEFRTRIQEALGLGNVRS